MAGPYETLDVAQDASHKDIQKAYRKLAKKLHPDLNPGDRAAEEQFKRASAAYAILGDESRRGRYDRGEIDDDGNEIAPRDASQRSARGTGPYRQGAGAFADFGDADELFSSFFSGMGQGASRIRKGQDAKFKLNVTLVDAASGATQTLVFPDGALDVHIPAGVRDGQILRIRGKGHAAVLDGPRGDALVEVHLMTDPRFKLEGDNLITDLPISIREAVLGARVKVPTLNGSVAVTVPPNSSSGQKLRLKGKGYRTKHGGYGDMLMAVKVVLPPEANESLKEFMTSWTDGEHFNPRAH